MLHPHNRVDMQEGSIQKMIYLVGPIIFPLSKAFWFFCKLHYLIFQLLLLSCSLSLALFSLEDNTVYSLSFIEALVDNASFLCLYVGPNGSPSFTCWSWNSLVWYVFLTCSFSFDQLLLFTRLVMFERRLLFVGVEPNVLLLALSPTISHANLRPQLS